MKYVPILQELLESDTYILLLLGIIISVIAGLRLKGRKRLGLALLGSAVAYGACECLSRFHTNFMLELILLFVGTAALGCCIGFAVCLVIRAIRRKGH